MKFEHFPRTCPGTFLNIFGAGWVGLVSLENFPSRGRSGQPFFPRPGRGVHPWCITYQWKEGFYIKQFLFPNGAVKLCFRAAMFLLRITFRWDYKSLCSRWKEELGGKIRPTRSIWRSLESQQKWTKLWGECIKWALTKPLYFNEMWFILISNQKGPNGFLIVIIIYHQIPTKHWMPCYLFWQFILLKKDTKSAPTDASLHSVKNLVLSR